MTTDLEAAMHEVGFRAKTVSSDRQGGVRDKLTPQARRIAQWLSETMTPGKPVDIRDEYRQMNTEFETFCRIAGRFIEEFSIRHASAFVLLIQFASFSGGYA